HASTACCLLRTADRRAARPGEDRSGQSCASLWRPSRCWRRVTGEPERRALATEFRRMALHPRRLSVVRERSCPVRGWFGSLAWFLRAIWGEATPLTLAPAGGEFHGQLLDLLQIELAAAENRQFRNLEKALRVGEPQIGQTTACQLVVKLRRGDAVERPVEHHQPFPFLFIRHAGHGANALGRSEELV